MPTTAPTEHGAQVHEFTREDLQAWRAQLESQWGSKQALIEKKERWGDLPRKEWKALRDFHRLEFFEGTGDFAHLSA